MAVTATLTDTFDTQINPAKWTVRSGTYVWDAGRARLTTTYPGGSYIATPNIYDFNNSYVFAKLTPGAAAGSREQQMAVLRSDLSNGAYLFITGNPHTLVLRRREGDTNFQNSITYNPVAHAWLRMRMSGGQFHYDASPDGITWTNLGGSQTTALDMSTSAIGFISGSYNNEGSTVFTYIDNVNVAPGAAIIEGRPKVFTAGSFYRKPSKVWNGTAWVEKPWKVWTGSTWKILSDAPTVVGYTTANSAAATFPVSVPAGVVNGDWLFTFIAAQSATITADFTIPSGWARVAWPFVASEGSMRFNAVYAHKVTATAEPASYTWGNAVVSRQVATCIAVRYANATTPVTAYAGVTTETLTTAPQIPVVTVPSNNSLVIGMAHNTNAAGVDGTHTFPAPWNVIARPSNPTPIAGLANDVMWLGYHNANAGSAGGQIGTVASGTPATDAGGIIVIGR